MTCPPSPKKPPKKPIYPCKNTTVIHSGIQQKPKHVFRPQEQKWFGPSFLLSTIQLNKYIIFFMLREHVIRIAVHCMQPDSNV